MHFINNNIYVDMGEKIDYFFTLYISMQIS